MSSSLEDVLIRLLVPDNTVILQATNDLRNILKESGINVALCQCLASCPNVQVRQYAAVLLRRKMIKAKQWKKVPPEIKQGMKQTVIEAYIKEPEKVVRASIAQLIASLAKHELPSGAWPELLLMLNQYIQSNNVNEKENGLVVLSAVTSAAGPVLKSHLKSLLSMLSKSLQDTSSKNIPFYAIKSLTSLVRCIGTEEMNIFQSMIPLLMEVIKNLASTDEELACEAMEIFDELVESEVAIIVPHIKPLIGLCLEIAANQSFEDNIRTKAMSIISWLTRLKKKTILKHKLVSPILEVLFPIICQPSENEEDNGESDDEIDENLSPSMFAAQVIDIMALHLPPEKLIPPLMHHLEPALASNDPYHKKAAYLALAVIAEGCSEYIRCRCLQSYLEVICRGINETNTVVRNAALYCLGQYAEFLQPEISKFAPDLLPVLCEYLSQTCQQLQHGEKDPPSLTKTFYALESFCENLGAELLPYLSVLMEKLMAFLTSTKSIHARELAISAIGAVASSAKKSIVPYFLPIIGNLKCYITEKQSDSNMTLQIQALDTLGILVQTVGIEASLPIAHDCMRFGLELLLKTDDPDLRRCTYGLFASLSTVLKEEMAQYLPTIVECMLSSLQSTEGVLPQYAQDDDDIGFTIFEDLEESEDEEDEISLDDSTEDQEDEEEITGYSVENSYLEEKEDTCTALKDIAGNVRIGFIPYLEKCFDEVRKLLENPGSDVRRAALSALGQFCVTLHQVYQESGSLEHRAALEKALSSFLPKLFATAREDTERQVVLSCFETLSDMLEKIKEIMLSSNPMLLEMITTLIKDALKHMLACQDDDDEFDELEVCEKAEYDGLLEEYAADIIPILARIVPSHQFSACFAGLLVFLLANTKRGCSVADKSFAIGTLAEVVHSMQPEASRPFFARLLPVFLAGMKDDNEEVRSNAVFGLGVLVENAGDMTFPRYPEMLQALSAMFSEEDNARTRDNLCSTVARLIMANVNAVPLNEVFPVYLRCLPLQEDMEENFTVYKCLLHLYNLRRQELFLNLPLILKTISDALTTQQFDEKTKAVIGQLLKGVHSEYPNDFGAVLNSLSPGNAQALRAVVTSS